jgi:Domain of unknown function (DUF4124)
MQHSTLQLTLAIILLNGVCASAGTIYKCKRPAGEMLYQEKPCDKQVQAISSWASSSMSAIETDDGTPERPARN